MASEELKANIDAASADDADKQDRERSSISFPYMDLDDAVAVAVAVQNTTGSSPCKHDQLAASLKLSMNSSGYRTRLAAARTFALIETERGGSVRLSELGLRIVNPDEQKRAKVAAFLSVELYKKLHEELRGKVVPPAAALERMMAQLGVAQKQTDRARQAFERSAQSAGFFDKGRDKLVEPAFGGSSDDDKDGLRGKGGGSGSAGSGKGDDLNLHPLIMGLVKTLPKNDGDTWPLEHRVHWLQIAVNTFSLLYGSNDEGEVQIVVKPKGTHSS
jgi:hypothetical protein